MNQNICTFGGRLTADPEVRQTGSGYDVCNARMAINPPSFRKDQEETLFLDLEIWGNRGLAFEEHLNKGDPVWVSGRLKSEEWKDRDDNVRTSLCVNVNDWGFVASGGDGDSRKGGGRKKSKRDDDDDDRGGRSRGRGKSRRRGRDDDNDDDDRGGRKGGSRRRRKSADDDDDDDGRARY